MVVHMALSFNALDQVFGRNNLCSKITHFCNFHCLPNLLTQPLILQLHRSSLPAQSHRTTAQKFTFSTDMKLTRPPPSWAHSHSSTVENLPSSRVLEIKILKILDCIMASEISMILVSSSDEGRTWTVLGAGTADDWLAPSWQFSFQAECSGFFAHV